MKRFLSLLLLLAGLAAPAQAQFSRIISIQLVNNNNTVAQSFQSNFSIKAGANCTWSVTGTVGTFNCSGGGGSSPAGATGTLQTNGGGGMFGAVTGTNSNVADCDGFGDPCQIFFTSSSTFRNIFAGTNTNAPMGNFFDFYNFPDGGLYLDASNGTTTASLGLAPSGSYLTTGAYGLVIDAPHKSVEASRLYLKAPALVAMDFSLSSGWGSTAAVSFSGASTDNNPRFIVTSDGSGAGANPTIVFTYHDGLFSGGSAPPTAVCKQSGGSGAIADTTESTTTTALTITWHATPAGGGATYNFSCFLIQGQP